MTEIKRRIPVVKTTRYTANPADLSHMASKAAATEFLAKRDLGLPVVLDEEPEENKAGTGKGCNPLFWLLKD